MARIQGAQGRLILGGDACDELTIIRWLDHGAATRAGGSHRFCRSDMIKGSCGKFFCWPGALSGRWRSAAIRLARQPGAKTKVTQDERRAEPPAPTLPSRCGLALAGGAAGARGWHRLGRLVHTAIRFDPRERTRDAENCPGAAIGRCRC